MAGRWKIPVFGAVVLAVIVSVACLWVAHSPPDSLAFLLDRGAKREVLNVGVPREVARTEEDYWNPNSLYLYSFKEDAESVTKGLRAELKARGWKEQASSDGLSNLTNDATNESCMVGSFPPNEIYPGEVKTKGVTSFVALYVPAKLSLYQRLRMFLHLQP